MKTASAAIFIDKYHPGRDGRCSVSIRITFDRKKKYYPTGIKLLTTDFDRVINAKRRTDPEKELYNSIHEFESKALKVISKLPAFAWGLFEDMYLQNREASDSIVGGFDAYISELEDEDRVGSATAYECAKTSLEKFRPGLKYAEITPALLRSYENWMLKTEGNSHTTVGIYLRSLRAVLNRAKIDPALYPFGKEKGKYKIPSGRNIKKALTIEEVGKIFNYELESGSSKEMARDYWVFLYLCNGMNVKDMCLLKWKNVEGDILKYIRAKTIRSKKELGEIKVSLKPQAKEVLSRWGVKSVSPETYIFPHIKNGMPARRQREIYQQVTKDINKHMKTIATDLEIKIPVTTYSARHSFATVLKRSGVNTEFISEALGHGDLKTTKNYLASFEAETIHKTTDVLTSFTKAI